MVNLRRTWLKLLSVFLTLAMTAGLVGAIGTNVALADGATTSMQIVITGPSGVTETDTVTAAEIDSLPTYNTYLYTIDQMGNLAYYLASGATIADVLTHYTSITPADVTVAKFTGTDGFWADVYPDQMFDTDYYTYIDSAGVHQTTGIPIPAIIATSEYDDVGSPTVYPAVPTPDQMTPAECLRNINGETSETGDTTECCVSVQNIDEMDITSSVNPGAPVITSITPTGGSTVGGATVTITGTGFTGATAVDFGTAVATSFTLNSSTSITATAPAENAGTVNVTVTTPVCASATSTADQFTYTAPAYSLGDVNGDGRVNLTDALMIAKYYMHQISLTSTQLAAADVNGDGRVNLTDALMIAKYYMHQISSL